VFDIIVSAALRQLSDYEDRCPAIFIPNDATEEAQELAQVAHHTIMGSVPDAPGCNVWGLGTEPRDSNHQIARLWRGATAR